MQVHSEFTVEPFVEGAPGPHVTAAIDAIEASGLRFEMGPFGTSVEGAADDVLDALANALRAAVAAGASTVSVQVTVTSRDD